MKYCNLKYVSKKLLPFLCDVKKVETLVQVAATFFLFKENIYLEVVEILKSMKFRKYG